MMSVCLFKRTLASACLLTALLTLTAVQTLAQEKETYSSISEMNTHQINEIREVITRLYNSYENSDRAWAAYLIGKHSLQEFIPVLENILDSVELDNSWGASLVRRAALDSLIQMKAVIPSEKIAPLFKQLPDETLVLLSVASDKNQEVLLSLVEQTKGGIRWTMINNLLAETKAPGLAAILLRDLKIEALITVSESGTVGSGGGVRWVSVGCGGSYQVPESFPPTAFYKLTNTPIRGAVVVTQGKYPIFYTRTFVQSGTSISAGSSDNGGDEDQKRLYYLAELLDISEKDLDIYPAPSFSIAWHSNESYLKEVASIRQQIKELYGHLLKRLVKADRLTADEAKFLEPNIIIEIKDERVNKRVRLAQVR